MTDENIIIIKNNNTVINAHITFKNIYLKKKKTSLVINIISK